MNDDNVHDTKPTQREDLKHVDTVSSGEPGSISSRVGRDPANLGDEITTAGDATIPSPDDEVPGSSDLTHSAPGNEPLGKAPAM